MKLTKGDLVIVETLDEKIITCIVVSTFEESSYLYVYCMDSGEYQLIYEKDISFIVQKEFAPSFPVDSELFNIDYSFYDYAPFNSVYSPFWNYFCPSDDEKDE